MANKRNDKNSVQARRERALGRWIQNRANNYSHGMSNAAFVDKQIDILLKRV